MSRPHLWGAGTARTLRPIWTAEELGLDYELTPIGPRTGATQQPEHLARNPKGKVPYMADGDFGLSESGAICRYLIARHGDDGPFFRPETLEDRAREDAWFSFILGELDATSLYVLRRHVGLAHIYGEAPVAAAAARDYCARQLVAAEQLFVGPFVMGPEIGLADILLKTCLDWAGRVDVVVPQRLADYAETLGARPAFRRAQDINQQPLR